MSSSTLEQMKEISRQVGAKEEGDERDEVMILIRK
jgi:hypothetical protein